MKKQIAIFAFEGISPFHLSVPAITFSGREIGDTHYEVSVCAERKGLLKTNAGFSIEITHDLTLFSTADIVIIPSWHEDVSITPSAALVEAILSAHQRNAQIIGLCLGAYVLAATGLLDGQSATTHWAFAGDFAARFPAIRLAADVLYIKAGQCMTSAGTAAGLDCCLSMIREQHGAEVANQVARSLVVPPHRQGGQAQYIVQPIPTSKRNGRLDDLMEEIRTNLAADYSIDQTADKALMSRRTFTRQFKQRTGKSFGDWLLDERLFYSQRLLETTSLTIEQIALQAGFNTSVTYRYHFSNQFGVSPIAWRKTFV
ncbi:AraC family transcriptional regulator [Leeia sp. TBRC 13508]|uniref:AraC family transcriptional regulator n=1 Tax=Leeia speluncae TaxID=2884804 RepID=A0ABS8D1E9_9NEIS|nr:helix-turn-helix domain-containing protein [Leeia speluncae]MCB6182019.1 AraC family transcriptional regulator [Leeia speluncae]